MKIKEMPYSQEAERGVLGCLLLDPKRFNEAAEIIRDPSEWFYDSRHVAVYRSLDGLQRAGRVPDMVLVVQALKDAYKSKADYWMPFLSELADSVPSAANLPAYLEVLSEKATARRLLRLCLETEAVVAKPDTKVYEALETFERAALAIRPSDGVQRTRKQMIGGAIERIERRAMAGGMPVWIPTGFCDLDRLTDGLHPGELIIIAAFPSVGKSALAGNIAEHCAVERQVATAIFSLEMTGEEWFERMMASRARVNVRGPLTERDIASLAGAAATLNATPLFIVDEHDLTIGQLRAKARRLQHEHKLGLVVVDYLQLLTAPDVRARDNREQEVSEIGRGLKAMAKELSLPVIALSQLNDDGRLRESRSIGQHADAVWKLNRDEENAETDTVTLLVEKQRNGGRGAVKLVFRRGLTRFENASIVA